MPTVFVNKLLVQIIKPALAEEDAPKPTFQTTFPSNVVDVLPIIIGKAPAGSELDPRFGADFASLQFDVYAADEDEAQEWSAWVRDELLNAYEAQTEYQQGHLSSFQTTTIPHKFPDQTLPEGIVRYLSEYRVGVKPPPP